MQKKSVFVLVVLSIITLGIYPAVWYIKRSKEFNRLNTQKKLSTGLAIFLLITTIVSIIINCIPKIMGIDFSQNTIFKIITIIISLTLLALNLFLAFRLRTILNRVWASKQISRKVSWFFTLIFNLYYLQYEINRTIENKEREKRIGPWVWFIIFLVLILLIAIIIGIVGIILIKQLGSGIGEIPYQ